jgi:hypothetical protein
MAEENGLFGEKRPLNPQAEIDLGVQDIMSSNIDGTTAQDVDIVNQIAASETANINPSLTNQDLFPGANQPLAAGQSSTRSLGSRPIFGSGATLLPINALEKREQARQRAAAVRANQLRSFEIGQAPDLNNPRFQKKFNQSFMNMNNDFIKEAKNVHGDKWDIALKSDATDIGRRYKLQMANFETVAKHGNQITDRAAEIIEGAEAGDLNVSGESMKLAREIAFRMGRLGEAEVGDILGMANQLEASVDLDKLIKENDLLKNFKPEQITSDPTFDDKGDFTLITQRTVSDAEPQLKNLARQLKRDKPLALKNYTEEQIFQRLNTKYGKQVSQKIKTIKKPTAKGADKFRQVRPEDVNVQKNKSFKFGDKDYNSSVSVPIIETDETIDIAGAQIFDPSTGVQLTEEIQSFNPVEFALIDNPEVIGKGFIGGETKDIEGNITPEPVLMGKATITVPDDLDPSKKVKKEINVVISTKGNEERLRTDLPGFFNKFEQEISNSKPAEQAPKSKTQKMNAQGQTSNQFDEDTEQRIRKVMDSNPDFTRDEIIEELKKQGKI